MHRFSNGQHTLTFVSAVGDLSVPLVGGDEEKQRERGSDRNNTGLCFIKLHWGTFVLFSQHADACHKLNFDFCSS